MYEVYVLNLNLFIYVMITFNQTSNVIISLYTITCPATKSLVIDIKVNFFSFTASILQKPPQNSAQVGEEPSTPPRKKADYSEFKS